MHTLTESDLPAAHRLSAAAGWNQTLGDWKRLRQLAPDTCFGINQDGHLVATTTLICYGQEVGWIGMVLTDVGYQRRGLARQLMEHAIAAAGQRSIRGVLLDATEQGKPLYTSLGFRDLEPIERWEGQPVAGGAQLTSDPLPLAVDRAAFGADRSALLLSLKSETSALVTRTGFVFGRQGYRTRYLGPCLSHCTDEARLLVEAQLTTGRGQTWCWDVLPANNQAVELARFFGFSRTRQLTRMCLGDPPSTQVEKIFAIAGFEYG